MTLGSKKWLGRNLNFSALGSFCYADEVANCDKEGHLYPWVVALNACPPGWHVSTDVEWKALESSLGMSPDDLEKEGYSTERGTNEGDTLKAGPFGVRLAGFRSGAMYAARGDRTYFWAATTRGVACGDAGSLPPRL